MKKLLLLAVIGLMTTVSTAQKGNTSSAGIAFKNYWGLKMSQMAGKDVDVEEMGKELADAKEFIDKSIVHEDTKDDPKTLMYYGKIYMEIPQAAMQSGNIKLAEVDAEKAFEDGYEALERSMELDEKERYVDDIKQYASTYALPLRQKGAEMYDEGKYEAAAGALLMSAVYGKLAGFTDSSAYLFGGLAAYNAKMWNEAAAGLGKAADLGYQIGTAVPYLTQSLVNADKADSAETVLNKMVAKYPDNKEVLIAQINYYIDTDNKEKAVKTLEDAIALDPENKVLIYTSATIYENMGDFDNAKNAYSKVLEMEPNNIDALSGLGGLYFNKAADLYNEANTLEFGDPKYDTLTNRSKEYFKEAVPYLEKAAEYAPNDCNVWIALRDAYGKAGDVENFKVAKKKANDCVQGVDVNGQTIKVGMTQSEVGKLLGEPDEIKSTDFKGTKLQTFVYGTTKINFAEGAVFTIEQ